MEKYNWKINLNKTLKTFPYEALVLTDETKNILWVNKGVFEMRGYPKSEAVNRNPGFYKAKKTGSGKTQNQEKIQLIKNFKKVVVNYCKNGEAYIYEVRIFPLVGDDSLHFLSLERKVAKNKKLSANNSITVNGNHDHFSHNLTIAVFSSSKRFF